MIIRACLPSDAPSIDTMFQEFVAYLRAIGDETIYRFGAQQYLTDGFGADPAFRGLVAEDASELIGYVLFCRTYEGDYVRTFNIVDLYVRQGSRSRGVGRQLMNAVRNIASDEGIARLAWAVHAHNTTALRFYEAIGATYTTDTKFMYLDLV
jgi:GNAT superfamily N-acetyltransferase